jgi:hypothetical protein
MLARFSQSYGPRVQYLCMRMRRDAITRLTAAQSTFKFVRGWCRKTVDYGRSGGGWISYSNSHQQQQQTTKPAGHPPSNARFLELPPTRHRRRPRRSPKINNRLSSHRRPLPPEPNRAPRTTVTATTRGPTTPPSFTAPPNPTR